MTDPIKPAEPKSKLSTLELVKRSADGRLSKQPMAGLQKITVEAGAQYALLDPLSGKPVAGLQLKRKGTALLVELEGERLEIENFYGETGVEFLPTGTPGAEGATGAAITPMSPPQATLASGEQLIWSPASDDGGYLLPLIGGGLLGLGLAAGDGGSSTPAPEPKPEPPVANFVNGIIVGGPVIAGNGLTVAVFAADGVTRLGEAKVNPDGSFSIAVGSYIGVVIARVVDSDTGADYLDEASGAGKDLNAELFSIDVVRTPNTTVTVNINVLTTLAYHKAIEQAGSAAPTTAVVDGVNKSVATLFGLEALHGTTVQPTNGGAFNAVDGLSQGETYGLILAAFSGADVANGGNSQQTVNEVLAGLTLSGGTATLAPTAQAGLIEGGKVVVENTGLDLGDEVSVIVDTVAPQFGAAQVALSVDENVAAGRLLHTASATDPSPVRYSLKAVGDHTAFSINASTGAVSLVGSPDFESKASYSLTVIATDAAGNASEQALSVTVNNLDESAPSISSGAQAGAVVENSGAGQVVYTATSTDAGDIATGSTRYSLKAVGDHAAFSIDANTGAVTLIGNPDFESKAGYSFTVVATDAAGNASEQVVSLAITDVAEAAPSFSSGGVANALNENSGAGQAVYSAVASGNGAVSYSLKPVGDHGLLSINASTGVVSLSGNPDHESKASYSFTVIATDAAGLASEREVSLNINDLDEVAPSITSGAVAAAIAENSGAGQVVYTASSTDTGDITTGSTSYSLKAVGDHTAFSINASTGAVSLTADPDFESKASYSFTVVATDAAGNASEQAVSLAITDVADGFPAISSVAISGATGALNNHLNAGDVISVTVTMNEATTVTGTPRLALNVGGVTVQADYVSGSGSTALVFQYTVQAGDADTNGISIGANALTLNGGTLKDGDGNDAVLSHGAVADNASYRVDNGVPVISSGAVATALNENAGAGQLVYTAAATDASALSYSLKAVGDHALLSINTNTGAVTLTGDPDHESKASYSFTVIATDAAGNASEQAVTLAINDLDEVAPTITSGAVAAAINENSGAGQVVYTATSTDVGDIATGSTSYSLKAAGDHAAFTINASTGAVSLTGNPDYETKTSYSFTVVATDAAGNASEQAVTLAINNLVDETAPSVASIAISGATGALNSTLNAGDVLSVTVTMDEATVVDTTGGTPRVALTLGASTVYATYVSGSASTALVFSYTVQNGDSDANGVSIGANALQANGGTLRDAAGNAAGLAHGAVADNAGFLVDTSAPSISSGGTAAAINENSGAGQTVYTAAATDAAAISYSLKAVGDHAAFGINASTGAVSLTGNPDYETKSSYSFTVVATDAAGNASEQAVSLTINDVDDTAPTVSSVALSAATGALNNRLNAGDVVSVTVTMNEATTVTGTPQLALNVGGSTVQANYVSGSGTTALVFQYTVQGGDTDANGISIGASALQLNGGTLRDAASNNATLTHGAVADNASYLVDTAAPTLSSSTPADNATAIAVGNNIVLNFSETVLAGSGNIVISNGAGDTRSISIADASQVSVSGSAVTINPTADLLAGSTYNVQMASGVLTDQAGNAYAGISNTTTLNFATQPAGPVNVVFDLIQGVSSDHSSRTFDASTTYTIYIRVNSNSNALSTAGSGPGTWGMWSGANNLGGDDKIVLVGNGTLPEGYPGFPASVHYNVSINGPGGPGDLVNDGMAWLGTSPVAELRRYGEFARTYMAVKNSLDLWNGSWAVNANPNAEHIHNAGTSLGQVYMAQMPAGILTSQGLI